MRRVFVFLSSSLINCIIGEELVMTGEVGGGEIVENVRGKDVETRRLQLQGGSLLTV